MENDETFGGELDEDASGNIEAAALLATIETEFHKLPNVSSGDVAKFKAMFGDLRALL